MAKRKPVFLQLLEVLNLHPNLAASRKEISAFEQKTALKLPAEIRELYEQCNGVVLKKNTLEILSLKASVKWVQAFRREGIPEVFGYLPFAEGFDSNPFCVCCSSPLIGHVVRVFHDEDAQLMFRSVSGFFQWILNFSSDDDWLLDKPGEFADNTRTKKDFAIARKIQELANSATGNEKIDARRFALTILSQETIDEIIAELEADDLYVREAAERRLHDMNQPKAAAALADYRKKMRKFAHKCIEKLAKVGISAEYHDKGQPGWWPELKVRAGKKSAHMNFPAFYNKRNHDDVWTWVVDRTKQALKLK